MRLAYVTSIGNWEADDDGNVERIVTERFVSIRWCCGFGYGRWRYDGLPVRRLRLGVVELHWGLMETIEAKP